jgi:hypothetical protein
MEKFTGGWFGFMEYQLENGTKKFRLVGKRSGTGGFKSKSVAINTLTEEVTNVEKKWTITNLPFTHYFNSERDAMAYAQSVRATIN